MQSKLLATKIVSKFFLEVDYQHKLINPNNFRNIMPAPAASASQNFFPIREITPYHKSWTIKGRVTQKSQMREFNRMGKGGGGGGQGKVFSIDLVDKDGGEIRASFFNEAAQKYGETVQQGKVYTFSRGQAKVSNRQYSQVNHEYEITFGPEAKIEETADDGEITNDVM